jgi:hypothetical protein
MRNLGIRRKACHRILVPMSLSPYYMQSQLRFNRCIGGSWSVIRAFFESTSTSRTHNTLRRHVYWSHLRTIVLIERVNLLGELPPLQLLSPIRLPKYLHLSVGVLDDEESDLWEFLDTLFEQPNSIRLATTIRITINRDTGEEFKWSDGATPLYSAFIGKLMTDAVRFYKRGIVIIDADGRDIKSLVD